MMIMHPHDATKREIKQRSGDTRSHGMRVGLLFSALCLLVYLPVCVIVTCKVSSLEELPNY